MKDFLDLLLAQLEGKSKEALANELTSRMNGGATAAVVPSGWLTTMDLEKFQPHPTRTRKDILFVETASFLAYFKEYAPTSTPKIFAKNNESGTVLTCVFDYDTPDKAKWNDHVAKLALDFHPDYLTLRESHAKSFTQLEFALFVEENLHVFTNPDSATMLEMAQHLKGVKNAKWQSGQRLSNSARKLEFVEEITGQIATRDNIEVPDYIELTCPLYEGQEAQTFKAAFSWRIDANGQVHFSYRLLTKQAERKAQEEVRMAVAKETGLPVLLCDSVRNPSYNLV